MQSILGTGQIERVQEDRGEPERQLARQPPADTLYSATAGDEDPEAAASMAAGVTALVVTTGLIAGFAAGGPLGGAAGLLIAGGGANLFRAKRLWKSEEPELKREAGTSLTFGLVGLGVGGYLSYKAYESRDDDD